MVVNVAILHEEKLMVYGNADVIDFVGMVEEPKKEDILSFSGELVTILDTIHEMYPSYEITPVELTWYYKVYCEQEDIPFQPIFGESEIIDVPDEELPF